MRRRRAVRLAGAAACAAVAACAQPSSPPGGEADRVPPRVVAVSPAPFDTVTELREPVVIEFDERLSIRLEGVQEWEDAVLVSPVTGEVRVEAGRASLEISVAGGWRPGLVYRVTVLPVFRDLFGNARREPVELVFSTGGPIPPTAVAGFVEDRLTGMPAVGARLEATRRLDSIVYLAVADTGGFFSLRHVPAGAYDVRAWADRDRDRRMEFAEPQDTAPLVLGFQDTVVLTMALLPMDTTPARLVRAEPVDSLRVRLQFDDYFAPGPVAGRGRLYLLPDTTPVSDARLIQATTLDSILAADRAAAEAARIAADSVRRAREDSIRAAAAAADTMALPADSLAPPDTARVRPAPPVREAQRPPAQGAPGQRPAGQRPAPGRPSAGASLSGEPLPGRELIAVLPAPLAPGTAYLLEVIGVTNIRGVPGGGGRAAFRTPARADTTAVPPDSIPVPPDSARP